MIEFPIEILQNQLNHNKITITNKMGTQTVILAITAESLGCKSRTKKWNKGGGIRKILL